MSKATPQKKKKKKKEEGKSKIILLMPDFYTVEPPPARPPKDHRISVRDSKEQRGILRKHGTFDGTMMVLRPCRY